MVTQTAQQQAIARYRRKAAAKGLVRVEVTVPADHAGLLKSLARALREDKVSPDALRRTVSSAPDRPETWGDYLRDAPDLSAATFDEIFDPPREAWPLRDVDLAPETSKP